MRFFGLVFLLTYCPSLFGYADPLEVTDTVNDQKRPKIGLVLSGGGAKGAAHVGVIKVLEANRIPVDYVVGTSIGAYVGGLYALGHSAQEVEQIMMNLPWDDSYSDMIPREFLSIEDKRLKDKYNIPFRLGYSDGQFKLPKGLLLGQTVQQLMQQSTDLIPTLSSFDYLAIPYRAIASDLATAQMVVLDSGSLGKAMKASAAVPGIVSAVEINGKLLVDGGITNNLPVDVIKEMGADIVIAVDIGSSLIQADEITGTLDVINQLSTILTNNTTLAQKQHLTAQDILLRPAIDDLSTTDFSVMSQALILGEAVALESIDKLKQYSVSELAYQQYQQQKQTIAVLETQAIDEPIIDIQLNNNSKVSDNIIKRHFDVALGDVITKEQLKQAIERVYGLDAFEQVNAEFVDTAEGRIIVLTTEKKSWGPNFINIGLSLKSDFSSHSIFALDLAYVMKDLTPNGGQWLNEVKFGWENELATEFYQPLSQQQRYFLRGRAQYSREKWEATDTRTELTNKYYRGNLSLGLNYADYGVIESGFTKIDGYLKKSDPRDDHEYEYNSTGGYINLNYDTLNSINFPTHGFKLSFEALHFYDEYDPLLTDETETESEATQLTLDIRGAFGFKNHTFVGIGSFATVVTDGDFTVHVSELGGFLNLSGYQQDALIGAHKVFAALVYQYDLGRTVPGSSELPIYVGTSLEAGNMWHVSQSVKFNDLITSGSLYLGTDTSFGPAVLGVGFTSDGEYSAFVSIGKNW
ncbi:patatin-like phospholipase family protein [Colwellia asteriadis]|uniref:Patatin-like phospholipase family protein n=1 Tax=Colwellia asteriadis TaxID=517723 RepID=A0ABP3WLA1_9GAMM